MSTQVVSVEPDAMVGEAIARMMEEHIGCVAVCEGARLVGIFTERDVLRLAARGGEFLELKVEAVMTPHPVVASPDLRILDAAEIKIGRAHV